jgi:hypothetical protein
MLILHLHHFPYGHRHKVALLICCVAIGYGLGIYPAASAMLVSLDSRKTCGSGKDTMISHVSPREEGP